MAGRYGSDRDDEGRFSGGRGGERARGRDWDDDNRGRNFGHGQYRERDEQGRFSSDDDHRSRGYDDSRYGQRGGDRYDYRGSGRGGERDIERNRDPYGRYIDEDFRGNRQFGGEGRYEENYRGGRGYEDDRGRGSSEGRGRGWFGGPEGHSEAARERWENDDRGGRGGNRGGEPERDERGRFMSDDDDRGARGGSRGRFQRDDDDRRDDRGGNRGGNRGGGGDHRGWFGDHRGHSQAAKLGWRHRQ